jgi:hypothetical protein
MGFSGVDSTDSVLHAPKFVADGLTARASTATVLQARPTDASQEQFAIGLLIEALAGELTS